MRRVTAALRRAIVARPPHRGATTREAHQQGAGQRLPLWVVLDASDVSIERSELAGLAQVECGGAAFEVHASLHNATRTLLRVAAWGEHTDLPPLTVRRAAAAFEDWAARSAGGADAEHVPPPDSLAALLGEVSYSDDATKFRMKLTLSAQPNRAAQRRASRADINNRRRLSPRATDATQADFLGCWHTARVGAPLLATAPRARLLVRFGVGHDNVDGRACGARSVPVCNVPDYGVEEVVVCV